MAFRFGKRKKTTYVKQKRRQAGKATSRISRILRVVLIVIGIALLVVPVLLLAHPVSYIPLIVALLTLVISGVYLHIVARSVSVTLSGSSLSCERGSEAGFAIQLSNRSFLPVPRVELSFFMTNLFGDVGDERTMAFALSPFQTTEAYFDATFEHLGKYQAGIRQVKTYDLLGLFSHTRVDGTLNDVLVRPAKVTLSGVAATQVMPDESQHMLKPIASDNEDYSSVREYQHGDPLKTVHWNLSSRMPSGKMFTRLYEEYVNPSLVIVLDSFCPDYDDETRMSLFDGIIECAAALCVQAQMNGVEAEVRFLGNDMEKEAAHLANEDDVISFIGRVHRVIAESESDGGTSEVEDMLRGAGLQTHGFGNVAFITSRADDACLQVLTSIRMRRRNAMAFVAIPRDLEGRERDDFWAPFLGLESVGINCYSVESTPLGTEVMGL